MAAEDGSSSCEWNAFGAADFGDEVARALREACCWRTTGVNVRKERRATCLGAGAEVVRKLRRTKREEDAILIVIIAPQMLHSCIT